MGHVSAGQQADRKLTEGRMKQKYGSGKMPYSGKNLKKETEDRKVCVSQGNGRKMSGSSLVPVRPACPISTGSETSLHPYPLRKQT